MNSWCATLFLTGLMLVSFPSRAEIFVCKDSNGKIIYQDEPCLNTTLRTLKNVPDAPIQDQILARERTDKANALSLQRAQLAETERQQQDKANREYQAIAIEKRKLELLERQNLESEQVIVPQWIVGGRTGFGVSRFNPYGYDTDGFGRRHYGRGNYGYPGKRHDDAYNYKRNPQNPNNSSNSNSGRQKMDRK